MTGNELRAARTSAGYSQKELGDRLGVSWQTIGQWERLGDEDVLTPRKRESAATKKAKALLVPRYRFLSGIGAFQTALMGAGEGMIIEPAPHDWPLYFEAGEPLILTTEPAGEGDLVLLKDADGKLSRIGRVIDTLDGQPLVRLLKGKVEKLPESGGYVTVDYYIHRCHDDGKWIPKNALDSLPADQI